jgi:toxin ParE1/3/4
MAGFRLFARALDDLRAIGRYTQNNWGRMQRDKYLSMLDASFHAIACQPGIGTACDYIRPGYKKYPAGRHLIFYRQSEQQVEIIRILHDSMDIGSHF